MPRKILLVLTFLLAPSLFVCAADTPPKAAESPLQRLLAEPKKQRLEEMATQAKAITAAKAALKVATIEGDKRAIAQEEKNVARFQSDLRRVIEKPLSEEKLHPLRLKTGQIGYIVQPGFTVSQILTKPKREVLVSAVFGPDLIVLKVVGVDTDNLVDGSRFSFGDYVAVVGTYTYKTVAGGEKTIFELHTCQPASIFTEPELKPFKEAMDTNYSLDLTDAEKAKAKSAMETTEKAEVERQRMKDTEAKAIRSKSYLDNGKLLLKNGKTAAAKKQLEKAVAESPDSEAGQEAKKLLDKTP